MKRRRPAVEAQGLKAPVMALSTAIQRLPIDKFAFNKLRYRWIEVVRGHPLLTPAQRQVGLVIAQQHINHTPDNPWFHSAWAGHQKIATEIGVTRRTVVTAMTALSRFGLIAIEHAGGVKVPGGRTDRYTLRIDCLETLARTAKVSGKDVKNFHRSNQEKLSQVDQSREKNAESGETDDEMIGNSQSEDVKGLRTTPSNKTFLESLSKTDSGPSTQSEPQSLAATQQASNGRKKTSHSVTSQDHHKLALLLGDGDLVEG